MGCDIHMVLERRYKDRWVGVHVFEGASGEAYVRHPDGTAGHQHVYLANPARGRNYALFAEIAGVRGKGPDPRGIPDDVSDLTEIEIDMWGTDGHSHSWLPFTEALPIWERLQFVGAADRIAGKSREEVRLASIEKLGVKDVSDAVRRGDETELADYRLVFWFDN